MVCKKCKMPIPYEASKCNNCYRKTGHNLSVGNGIVEDMFGNSCYLVNVDKDKNSARYRYIHKLKEYRHLAEVKEKVRKKKFDIFKLLTILLYVGMFVALFVTMYITFVAKSNPDIKSVIILPAAVLFCSIPTIYIVGIIRGIFIRSKEKKIERLERTVRIHDCKKVYYANANVFGYVVFDRTEKWTDRDGDKHYTDYYGYYEVDKRNIVSIGYDSYFAEYVLMLNKPIYIDYSFEPTTEFRVQDVFDDSVLSNALSCDLPAKNIPF